jgi:phosphoribosylanthranilate isomerase
VAKIKLCGMTNLEDCERAIDLSVDFVGFVFYKRSRRYIKPQDAACITREIGGRARKVGVFVEERDDEIAKIMAFCHLDFCQVYRKAAVAKSITVYRMKDGLTEEPVSEGLILFDSLSRGFGGSGTSFDVDILEGAPFLDRAFIAGGIGEANVFNALRLGPFGVDLVSSVEAYPGKKDHRKMEAFVNKVRSFVI